MFRTALAWTLLAAFSVTLPVTGGGQCPCRFVRTLRAPAAPSTQTTAPSQAGKGCCPSCHRSLPDLPAGDRHPTPRPPGDPTDVPCDHNLLVDAAQAGAAGERSGLDRGAPDDGPIDGTAYLPLPHLAHAPRSASDPPASAPGGRHLLRYAHAFRS
jgi:hypothetical protein